MNYIKLNDKGWKVKHVQCLLGIVADGIFGSKTEEAVMQFQMKNNLVADGVIGEKTFCKLTGLETCIRWINEIIIHCSATIEGKDYTVDDIRRWHRQRGFDDIGYHYVIYRDGSVHVGRKLQRTGAHCVAHNSNSIGVCYIGGCGSSVSIAKDTRTDAQKSSMTKLIRSLMILHALDVTNIHGHYEYSNKACPSFDVSQFKSGLKDG